MIVAAFQGPAEDFLPELADAAARARGGGAELVICPEMATTGYNIGESIEDLAEQADGPTARRIAEICREHRIAIAYGYPERGLGTVYNSVQLIDADGRIRANYRKTHLFGDLDKAHFSAGDRTVVQAEIGGLTVGLLICYDVEFPEMVRAHALAGTELLAVPTALMRPYEIVADVVVPARAYESQLFLAYVNRCDTEGELTYCGRSVVMAPDGTELARAGSATELLLATVDPDRLAASRRENTYLADRRPELYERLELSGKKAQA
ncbi:carbon-nitrogen hydrolase family protein [Amycolatopsis magusensis]|uniref:carbon-nitrogen hydrolase family protein n=1 Tax=Amycolatopsis magusensis TaxID=882444 RepID=UPI0024A95A24|nr:carbon-nitrogen hydrolase family protein [Amycolatopsis magusensis]MDI5976989.1 carbon-nitrogen hydrolase family protein [Amycolatopsis magusensis]